MIAKAYATNPQVVPLIQVQGPGETPRVYSVFPEFDFFTFT
jgi:hypothetical protein